METNYKDMREMERIFFEDFEKQWLKCYHKNHLTNQDLIAGLAGKVSHSETTLVRLENGTPSKPGHIKLQLTQNHSGSDDYNVGVDASKVKSILSQEGHIFRSALVMSDASDASKTSFGFATSSNQGANWQPRLVIANNGNIGINKKNPTQSLDVTGNVLVSGTINGRNLVADGSKLDTIDTSRLNSIQTGATKNDTDQNLRMRCSHTGTQLANTISDFDQAVSCSSHAANTNNPHHVTKAQLGLENVQNVKVNLTATTGPSNQMDITSGYTIGSYWFDVVAKKGYACVDSTCNKAIWKNITDAGDINASNIGVGVGICQPSSGNDLKFRSLTAGSNKVLLSSNCNEVQIDIDPCQISIGSLKGAPAGALLGDSDPQTLHNKTISGLANTLSNIPASSLLPGLDASKIASGHVSNEEFECLANVTSDLQSQLDSKANTKHAHISSDISDFNLASDARINTQKGQPNGLASLDNTGRIPASQLTLTGGLIYNGGWNALTNSPKLLSGVGSLGIFYIVNTSGTSNIDGINTWYVGDWVVYNGSAWERVNNFNHVTSVAGRQGDILLDASDISSGVLSDARISSSSVLQHQASLNILALQGAPKSEIVGLTDIQSLSNKTISGLANHLTDISPTSLSAGIDASKIADGSVSNQQFQQLANVKSNLQQQLDSKANIAHGHSASDIVGGTLADSLVTESNILQHERALTLANQRGAPSSAIVGSTDAQTLTNKKISALNNDISDIGDLNLLAGIDVRKLGRGTVTNTTFDYLSNVTGDVQSQINAKSNSLHTHSTSDIVDGTFDDARISVSNVLQHQHLMDLFQMTGAPKSDIVGLTDTQVLSNKTISALNNKLRDIDDSCLLPGINIQKIGDGSITNQQFLQLAGLNGNIQHQINTKCDKGHVHSTADIISGSFPDAMIVESNVLQYEKCLNLANQKGAPNSTIVGVEDAQVLSNKTLSALTNNFSDIGDKHLLAGISATKLGSGKVSNDTFDYLANATSDIQTQINGKSNLGHSHSTSEITSGTFEDARIALSNVLQYEKYFTLANLIGAPKSALVGITDYQNLVNKGLSNGSVYFYDDVGPSKILRFDSSSAAKNTCLTLVSTSTVNRTINFPDISDTLVGLNAPQTLTNKTLTNPIISQINNGGVLVLPTTNDTLVGRNTKDTLTNKNLTSANVVFCDNNDPSKTIGFDLVQSSSNSKLTFVSTSTINRAISFPDISDTVVTLTAKQILANKTISGLNNNLTDIGDSCLMAGLSASKIGDGSVSNQKFSYLANVSSDLQSQINSKANTSHSHLAKDISDFTVAVDARINNQKAQPNGLAVLDANGMIPSSQLRLNGALQYQGRWNANTNNPVLVSGQGTLGYMYIVGVAGNTLLDEITNWNVGDLVIFDGDRWDQVNNTNKVQSVAGKSGVMTLTAADITSGLLSDNRIAQSNVLQHQSAINILALVGAPTSAVVGINDKQSLQNKIINGSVNTITNLNDSCIAVAAGINASKIANGTVTNTQFQYLANCSSNLQQQLDSKANTSHSHTVADISSGIFPDAMVAQSSILQHQAAIDILSLKGAPTSAVVGINSYMVLTNKTLLASKNNILGLTNASVADGAAINASKLGTGVVNNTTFNYLANVTSDLQSQLNSKANTIHNHDASSIVSGVLADSRISRSSVIQHQSSISIASLSGAPCSNVVGISDNQALTNKILDSPTNSITADKLRYPGGTISLTAGSIPSVGQILTISSNNTANWQNPVVSGTLNKVDLTMPSEFSVTNTSNTSNTLLTVNKNNQTSGFVYAGASKDINLGNNNVETGDDTNRAGLLVASSYVLNQTATLLSFSFYVTVTGGNLRLALYSNNGSSPGLLKASTLEFTPVVGWNTIPVISPISLSSGTYWLAYMAQTNTLRFPINTSNGTSKYYSTFYGSMPVNWNTIGNTSITAQWSFYANLVLPASSSSPGFRALTYSDIPDLSSNYANLSSAQNLFNKALDASCVHVDTNDTSKRLAFQFNGATSGTILNLVSQQTSSQSLNIPNISSSDTLMTTASSQLITGSKSFTNMNSIMGSGANNYTSGTISQQSNIISGVGTSFNSSMVGGSVVFNNGTYAFVLGVNSPTSLLVAPTQTVSSQGYTMYYGGYQLDNNGNMGAKRLVLNSNNATSKSLLVVAAPGQTSNLSEWQNFSGVPQALINANGNFDTNSYSNSYNIYGLPVLQMPVLSSVLVGNTGNTAGSNLGINNTLVGVNAGASMTSSHNNTLFGYNAGASMTTSVNANYCTFGGSNAGWQSTGDSNTLYGNSAGYALTKGSWNVALGANALQSGGPYTGSYNTLLGGATSLSASNVSSATVLGYGSSAATGGIGLGWTASANTNELAVRAGNGTYVLKSNGNTLSLPNANSSLTLGSNIISFPAASDTLVGLSTPQTLLNKTLTNPIISAINNGGTLILPTSNDTLVGRSTADFLSNKSFTMGSLTNSTGLASQNGNLLIGVGTAFNSLMIGGLVIFNNGVQAFVISCNSTTSLSVTPNQTVTNQAFTIYYNGLQIDVNGNISSDKYLFMQNNTTYLVDSIDASKRIMFASNLASTNTILTLASQQTTSQTLLLPNITSGDTLVVAGSNQTLINKTISGLNNTLSNIGDASLVNGINCTKIGDGSVNNTSLKCLSGITSNIQCQLDSKANNCHSHTSSDITDISNTINNIINLQKSCSGGLASLDCNGRICQDHLSPRVGRVCDRFQNTAYLTNSTANSSTTLTAKQLFSSIVVSNPPANIIFNLPVASLIVSSDSDADVSEGFHFYIINTSVANTITLAGAKGLTLVGKMVISPTSTGHFYLSYTNVSKNSEGVTIFAL